MLSGKKRPPVKLSLFTNFSESFSSDYSLKLETLSKSPRNFEGGVVGLGIVAAMNDTHEAFRSAKSSRAAKMAVSPKSEPIPIVSAKNIVKFREPIVEKDEEIELSESYTCVISHLGNGKSVRKKEYFDEPEEVNWGNSGVFFTSPPPPPPPPPKNTQGGGALVFQGGDFLSSCYLCRKKLHGLDIFMYRGDRAFCSAECRSKQISSDEFKEKCGSGALKKAFDYSVTPCSAPRFLSSGVAAA